MGEVYRETSGETFEHGAPKALFKTRRWRAGLNLRLNMTSRAMASGF